MPAQLLVLDEWLFHHLKGEAGAEGQREAFRIPQEIERRCDRIAWKRDTSWVRMDVIKRVFPTIKAVHLKDFAKSFVGGSPGDGGP